LIEFEKRASMVSESHRQARRNTMNAENPSMKRVRELLLTNGRYANRIFRADFEETASGSPCVKIEPLVPGCAVASTRQRAALIHELCADLERWSDAYKMIWLVVAKPMDGRIVIEAETEQERKKARDLLRGALKAYYLAADALDRGADVP
jgi:hypothetical protein